MANTSTQAQLTSCPECGFGPFTRNHFFTGKLMTARESGQGYWVEDYVADTMRTDSNRNGKEGTIIAEPAHNMAVRRLTPVECERLQGFPDNYTNIPWRGKPIAPDGPRYKALGNSMAVPCMAWIGKRIQEVEAILEEQRK